MPETLLPDEEALRWAAELEAFERDRHLAARNATLAREARVLAREIRDLAVELRDARAGGDHATTGILLENLGSLRKRALDIMSGRP